MTNLTARQAQVLFTIQDFTARNHYSPTLRDLAGILDIASTNGVRSLLEPLLKKGRISRPGKIARGMQVIRPVTADEMARVSQ